MSDDVLKKSVTAGDASAGVYRFYLAPTNGYSVAPSLPPFWSHERDAMLLSTLYREANWAAAIYTAVSKTVSKSWKVDSDIPLRAKRAQELFLTFDTGKGWTSGMSKHLQAYLLAGNGGPVEIVRATSAAGSRILGLVPLDTLRTTRTGDPDIPAIYRDRLGRVHELKSHQVFFITDMPDQSETWYGVGHCAAERAYRKIVQAEAIETYLTEKVSGRRPLAIHMISGMRTETIQGVIRGAQEEAHAMGLSNFMGAAIAGTIDPTAAVSVATIPLAEIPDGFTPADERRETRLIYADAIGIDPQDIDPSLISRAALGGSQSVVLDDKAEGKGLSAWLKSWEHAVNEYVLDAATTFYFMENDLRDQKQRAEISKMRADTAKVMVDGGILTPAQALQTLVDAEEVPGEFLPADMTPDTDLSDQEKPESAIEQEQATPGATPNTATTPAILPTPTASKAASKLDAKKIVDEELAEAARLVKRLAQNA